MKSKRRNILWFALLALLAGSIGRAAAEGQAFLHPGMLQNPLIKNFFPEANGNWDAAIMDTMLCIGVYCDDRDMFQRAVEHFLRGPGNGGIAKYIYPSGQCEERARDNVGNGTVSKSARMVS